MTTADALLRSLENLVHACDWDEIESWRPRIRVEHVAPLVALYDSVQSWGERCAVLQLLQDTRHLEVSRRMHHFLSAPPEPKGDNFELTKATAICHLENDFARFTTYYGNRRKLAEDIAAWRAKPAPS
jgi:hypothetical protein